MISKQSWIYFTLEDFESTAGHISSANGLKLLHCELITEVVKAIIDLVHQIDQVLATVLHTKLVEVANLDNHESDICLQLRETFLALLKLLSDNGWHQNVDDALELLVLFVLPVMGHEVDLPCHFVPVGIVHPQEHIGDDAKGHPRELQILLDRQSLTFFLLFLDDRQSDVQE